MMMQSPLRRIALAAMVALGTSSIVSAQEAEAVESRFSLTIGADVASAYYFRGIAQENQGLITQPYAELAYSLYTGNEDSTLNAVTAKIGTWNSIHDGPSQDGGGEAKHWYESDAYVSLNFQFLNDWTASAGYTLYLSPNDAFDEVQEVSFGLSYDDTRHLGKFALKPRALVAFETKNEADSGNSEFGGSGTDSGIYLELGVTPSYVFTDKDNSPSLQFPVAVGLSLKDYYEDASGEDQFFGYVDVGAELNVPFTLGGSSWNFRGGPHIIYMGQNATEIGEGVTGGDDFDVWYRVGLSVTF